MEQITNAVNYLKDPIHVWNFQRFFGLRKIREVRSLSEEGNWIALDSRTVPAPLPESVRVPSTPVITQSSFEREYRINQRVRAIRKSLDTEDDDVCSSGYSSEGDTPEEEASVMYYKIGSYFWHILFHFATGLGDETFSAPVFVFIILNIDGNIGRQVLFIYCMLMYIGQAIKDKVGWPRPSMPPVIQMERKWALEYGMPSTHAMVGLGVPLSIFIFSSSRFHVDPVLATAVTIVWCSLVSSSRIYLGMHSFADIVAGLGLAAFLMPILVIFSFQTDKFLVQWAWSPLVTLSLSLFSIWIYPSSGRWTPARGETTAILGSYIGVQLGYWFNYQVGLLTSGGKQEEFIFNQWILLNMIVRSVIGGLLGGLAKSGTKPLWIRISCYVDGIDHTHYENSRNLFVELFYKFWSYLSLSFAVVFVSPLLFSLLGCQRASFYTEL